MSGGDDRDDRPTSELAEAYGRHAFTVQSLSRRILQSDLGAEEITQEVFLDVWQHPERFDPGRGSLRTFLLALTRGKSIDLVRSETARRRREDRSGRETSVADLDVPDRVWDMMVAERVKLAVADLPDELRKPIELRFFEGQSFRDVARALGAPESTVKSRVGVGLRQLRSTLLALQAVPVGT